MPLVKMMIVWNSFCLEKKCVICCPFPLWFLKPLKISKPYFLCLSSSWFCFVKTFLDCYCPLESKKRGNHHFQLIMSSLLQKCPWTTKKTMILLKLLPRNEWATSLFYFSIKECLILLWNCKQDYEWMTKYLVIKVTFSHPGII